jgi:hypothetical protein
MRISFRQPVQCSPRQSTVVSASREGLQLLATPFASITLPAVAKENLDFLGQDCSLAGLSGNLLYLPGLSAEVFIPTAIENVARQRLGGM